MIGLGCGLWSTASARGELPCTVALLAPVERAVFAMTANRALAPSSKLAMEDWKDHRPDMLQVVIGLTVTRDGIPVRCWVWPGNAVDVEIIGDAKKDMTGWKLGRVITVVDRGFSFDANLRHLQRAGGHYIAGERNRRKSAKSASNTLTKDLQKGAARPIKRREPPNSRPRR